MVEQNGANNDLAVRALSLEKKLSCLEDENAALAKEKSSNAIVMQRLEKHNTELLEQLNLLEDEKKESECLFKENTFVMEEQLRVYKAQLGEARQEASKWEDDLKQVCTHMQTLTHTHTHVCVDVCIYVCISTFVYAVRMCVHADLHCHIYVPLCGMAMPHMTSGMSHDIT